ncbi:MAG: 5-methyltetrahydropteroyltriglutamate--homocysteine S-methyltransferase [Rickettsiales bacterium]|nr:5-methyltetrahydropteroyltriglutamate--homocysteine S-methyltransferase [Rickettsiales bacterium]
MAIATNLGFPRIGPNRELKKALEAYWKGQTSQDDLLTVAKAIREQNWKLQKDSGIEQVPSNDFSFYDQVLDHIHMFGAIPARYEALKNEDPLTLYFAMARGRQADGVDVVAMEMTKWFDTNYHYIVPEFEPDQTFELTTRKPLDEFNEAKAMGVQTRPVIIGPVTFLSQGKMRKGDGNTLSLLPKLLPVYTQLIKELADAGAEWIQIDEPVLALDIDDATKSALGEAFDAISAAKGNAKILVTSYFDGLRENTGTAFSLAVDAVHVDLVRAPGQLDAVLGAVNENQSLSLGVIDGRNIWKTNFEAALEKLNKAKAEIGADRIFVAPSCSMLHSPVDLGAETELDAKIKEWLAFATQKLEEISVLTKAINGEDVSAALAANKEAMESRATSKRIHNPEVKDRAAKVTEEMMSRKQSFDKRISLQEDALKLPPLPTTTIGSFPQTQEIRAARAQFKKGDLSAADYQTFLEEKTAECIAKQEEIGIDVLVHGEYERNDMVEYFGENLDGFAFTKFAWVQSYGSRCVKPPIIFGDVSRPNPMTVDWAKFSQSKTDKPMKGMLTGPVTILQWSFVRDDQPRSETCKQIALAIRDEVVDLESAGIAVIQIDEAALREGLPLRKEDWKQYLDWAVESFRITASGVKDETQIHTHMCYSEFNDIIEAVARMDADVISIETSRSAMELLEAFVEFKYPNQIGPGVYDIHSPRVPNQSEMETLLSKALEVLKPEQIWVNPDCGLKTRGWAEVEPALKSMVEAAKTTRARIDELQAKAS